jgi:pilus assembly protein CpaE
MTMLTELSTMTAPAAPRPRAEDTMTRVPHITIHAFCDSPQMAEAMTAAFADRRMARSNAALHRGGIDAAIELYRGTASPNLLIIEHPASAPDIHQRLDVLADLCVAGTKLVVIGYVNDVDLYRQLMMRGVSEYIVAPVDPIMIVGTIGRLFEDPGASKLGRSIAFIGAKGGVGSSTMAQNVASTIARSTGADVILADLDLPFGSSSLGFNIEAGQGVAQALQDGDRLDDVLLERLLSQTEEHLCVLTAPANLEAPFDLGEQAFERLVDVAMATAPFVVLDVPHVWTAWAKKTIFAVDEVVITAEPNLACLRNAKNLIELIRQARPNDAPPKLVLNRVGVPKQAEIKPQKFSAALQSEPLACVPFEPAVLSNAANNGKMVADVAARSAVAKSFETIANAVSGRPMRTPSGKSRFALGSLWKN